MSKFDDKGYQAYRILQFAFVVAPLIAGIDKFFNLLTNWSQYLSPVAQHVLHYHNHEFMAAVGIIEIIAGIGVLLKPKFFAYVVALWLLAITINLLLDFHYDIALRDFGLALAAFSLGKLSQKYEN